MEHVLITGGAGFVGSNLARRLLAGGTKVTLLDNYSNAKKGDLKSETDCLDVDLANEGWITQISDQNFSAVVHCAAQASNAKSFEDPFGDLSSNQLSTLNVLKFCKLKKVKRLVFTSTMSAYGDTDIYPTPPTQPLKPQSFYAVHKVASENYIRLSSDLDWTIFRLFTTYGGGQNLENKQQGLVKIFLSYILRGENVEVHGSGDRVRDIIHVDDVARALEMSIKSPATFQQTYNLGSGQTITIDEIIKRLALQLTGSTDYPVDYLDGDVGDPFRTHADISSCFKDFGWKATIAPLEGIDRTAEYYIKERI